MPAVRNLRKLSLSRVDLVPKGSNPGAHITLFKQAPDETPAEDHSPDSQGPTSSKENPMSQTATEAPAATEEVETEATNTEATEATTEVTENTEATAETTATETVAETAPEPVAAGVEKAEVETITKAEAEALRSEIEILKADKREATYITKAEKDYPALGNSAAVAKMLMAADDSFEKAEADTLRTMLKAFAEQAETGALFEQFGKADAEPNDREAELNKLAAERVEKGESKTIEQARVAVMDANPALRPDNTTVRS